MNAIRILIAACLLAFGNAYAQSGANAEEISFWETVRDSKNPAELQAYIDQYPNGRFVVLARARLAALHRPGATPAAPPPLRAKPAAPPVAAAAPSGSPLPQVGDTWTYRLTYPRLRGQWGQAARPPQLHVVKAASVAEGRVVDQLSVDGGTPIMVEHARGSYLVPEGVSIYSPYLLAFGDAAAGRLPSITIRDPACGGNYVCRATGRIAGQERIAVWGSDFLATKVIIDHEWRPYAAFGQQSGQFIGGRTLTVWYVPELRRAVKYTSRLTVGDAPPVDSNFDLELVSFDLQ